MLRKDNWKLIPVHENENEGYYDTGSRIYGRNDNAKNILEHDCHEMGLSGVKDGEIRGKRKRPFAKLDKKVALVFLMRLAGFTSKQICPIAKISPKTITRYVKSVYVKYPRLKNI